MSTAVTVVKRYSGSYRKECPVRVAIFCMLGYFHTITWLREYPCVETISFTFFDHMRLQTWGTKCIEESNDV
jgi:hypothetical protein